MLRKYWIPIRLVEYSASYPVFFISGIRPYARYDKPDIRPYIQVLENAGYPVKLLVSSFLTKARNLLITKNLILGNANVPVFTVV